MHSTAPTPHRKQRIMMISAIVGLLLVCIAFFALKYVGSRYTTQIITQQIEESGLTPLIHYKKITFDTLTLSPVMHSVSIGNQRYPWLRFSKITFNALPINYPQLDIEFQFDDSQQPLARDTQRLLAIAGVNQLTGHGRFLSKPNGNNIDSTLTLTMPHLGQLYLSTNLDILDADFSLHELRSDLLASLALGQLDAMPILYGESVALHKLALRFQDNGLTKQIWPHSQSNEKRLLVKSIINSIGLAAYDSPQAEYLATQFENFLANPKQLSFSMLPKKAIKLSSLMKFSQEKSLYLKSDMALMAKQ
ncbi:hypothetical protein [Marinomonas pollencensis]|uniref:Uncharacterized protein n=1 Tax=Marinomonas pollencensis TaxID=491954 RepID=A0A3E0DRM8_9GAMM|nr:hypothetical protein [Marinomonas pollencensis]REG84985.1 hypothetical protein DFP81_103184 [Marinomonas pollencensis]